MTTKHLFVWSDATDDHVACGATVDSYDDHLSTSNIHLVTCLHCLERVRDAGLLAQSRLDALTMGGVL